MARKPTEKPASKLLSPKVSRAGAIQSAAQSATKQVRPAASNDELRRDLAAARARIAELENNRRELARRIDNAMSAIHKLLEG